MLLNITVCKLTLIIMFCWYISDIIYTCNGIYVIGDDYSGKLNTTEAEDPYNQVDVTEAEQEAKPTW